MIDHYFRTSHSCSAIFLGVKCFATNLVRFVVVVELVAGVEAHGADLTPVLLHGVRPQVLVELGLVVEGLVAVFALVRFVQVAGEDVGFEVSAGMAC